MKIIVKEDYSCDMACVYLEDECIMEGNLWDFHNGCHGLYKYGDFDSLSELVSRLEEYVVDLDKVPEVIYEEYDY